jgi:hypothetical protein
MRHPPRLALLGTSSAAAALLIGATLAVIPSAQSANALQQPNPSCNSCKQAIPNVGPVKTVSPAAGPVRNVSPAAGPVKS